MESQLTKLGSETLTPVHRHALLPLADAACDGLKQSEGQFGHRADRPASAVIGMH
jgi:hypothetical protein